MSSSNMQKVAAEQEGISSSLHAVSLGQEIMSLHLGKGDRN